MNRVFNENGIEITNDGYKILYAMGFNSRKFYGRISTGEALQRIQGKGHCNCFGEGIFDLLPVDHPDVIDGQKRYMICRKCGCYSHL